MKKFRSITAFFLIVSMALSGPVGAAYQFSEYSFSRNPARVDNQMRIQMTGRTALRSYRFVGRVGGVNFEEVVDMSGVDFDISYDPRKPDGVRATLDTNGNSYSIPLYDWELLPIANYADSKYTAVVSIFGEGPDPESYRYINYHPAFEDTHLGMRLLQADIMLMDPMVFSEAPSESGQKVYMPGESREIGVEEREVVTFFIDILLRDSNFQAWVLTDTDEDPELVLSDGKASVDMQPYYYFWRSVDAPNTEEKLALFEQLRTEAIQLEQRYNAAYQKYLRAPSGSNEEASALLEAKQIEQILEPKINQVSALFEELQNYEPEIQEVEDLTQIVKENYNQVSMVAPFVYEAVEKTSDFSALFRGIKQQNAGEWQSFLDTVRSNISLPPVETPNQFAR